MRRFIPAVALLTIAIYGLALAGCDSTANHTEKPKVAKGGGDHDHEHHHHGPHDGHIAGTPDEKYHVEWTHEDSGKVNLYVLDAKAEKEVPIEASELVIVAKHSGEAKEYTLSAMDPTGGKSARFEIVDKDLLGTLEALSEEITAEVKQLEVGGKTYDNVKMTMDHHH